MDQGSTMKRSAVHNFAPTVTKFCVMWEGQALPHDTKFGNSRCEIVGRRVIFIWSLIHGLRWSGLIKAEPGRTQIKSKPVIWISENMIRNFEVTNGIHSILPHNNNKTLQFHDYLVNAVRKHGQEFQTLFNSYLAHIPHVAICSGIVDAVYGI